jgi:hypothetical protein
VKTPTQASGWEADESAVLSIVHEQIHYSNTHKTQEAHSTQLNLAFAKLSQKLPDISTAFPDRTI